MRRAVVVAVLVFVGAACAEKGAPPAEGSSASPDAVARVDLVEAGIRAVVAQNARVVFVETKLCSGYPEKTDACPSTLTDDEVGILATRLSDLSDDIRFVPSYDAIPDGQAPIESVGRDLVFVGPPRDQGDGTYWIEAGETCGGLCGHGGTYVLVERDGRWVSTGNAPGTGTWVS